MCDGIEHLNDVVLHMAPGMCSWCMLVEFAVLREGLDDRGCLEAVITTRGIAIIALARSLTKGAMTYTVRTGSMRFRSTDLCPRHQPMLCRSLNGGQRRTCIRNTLTHCCFPAR